MLKLSKLFIVLAMAAVCLVVFLGPPYLAPFISGGFDSMVAFFLVIYAGLIGYIIVKERLIFGPEERKVKRTVRKQL